MEVYFEPLTPGHIEEIVANSAYRLGINIAPEVGQIISQYCHDGRAANKILLDAYGLTMNIGQRLQVSGTTFMRRFKTAGLLLLLKTMPLMSRRWDESTELDCQVMWAH